MSKSGLLFALTLYVNAKKSFTAQEVAAEFQISVRTAHRYLMELSKSGIPLYTEQGRNGGYRVLNNRVLPPILFDENEALAIFFAFQALKYYRSLPFEINLASASRKLLMILPQDAKNKVDRLAEVLSFWNHRRSVPAPFLTEIIEAAINDWVITIEYQSHSENTVRAVKPVGVYAHDGLWYMSAFERSSEAVRVYRVDRILSLETTHTVLEVQHTLQDWLDHHPVRDPVRLRVTLTREGVRQCRSEPWLAPDVVVIDEAHGQIDAEIDRSEMEFVSGYFFQLGAEATVLAPPEMIETIKHRALEITRHYQ